MQVPNDIIKKGEDLLISENFKNRLQQLIFEEESEEDDYKLFIDKDISFDENIIKEFIEFCLNYLKIKSGSGLKVVLSTEKDKFGTYAFYDINNKVAAVYSTNRAIIDCMRSLAHELVHHKQNMFEELPKEQISDDNDGTPIENEANSVAGIIMRKFGREHPELY